MVDKNSPIFIACRPTGVIAILLTFGVAILLFSGVSAANPITNGGFETGDFTGWTSYGSAISNTVVAGGYDTYWCRMYADKYDTYYSGVLQNFDSTGYDSIEFNFYSSWSNRPQLVQVYDYTTSTYVYNNDFDSTSGWQYRSIDLTGLEGHNLQFKCAVWDTAYLDDVICIPTPVSDVSWNQSSYSVGDTGSMSYSILGYNSSTYDYSIDIFEGSTFKSYCHLSSNVSTASYTFSGVVEPVTYYAKLTKRVKGSSIPLVITTDSCTVGPSDVSIIFNQSIYGPDELVSISYYNCPNGSKIILQDDITPHQVSNTWVDISGNGSVSYQLSNANANRVFYAKVYSVSDIVLASDYMQIDDISSGYCQVHGGIYDSQDYHPLIGTVFIGDSYSDVVGYSDYGAYSIIVPWGTYDISAVVSSYLTHNISNVVISGSSYDLNMFLSVNDTTTHVFRGSVTDADTNAVVDGVLVQVYNDTFDEYDFTSQSGVWVVNGLTSGANYTLHATKDDYHSYTYSFMYDPGDFYHNFMMSSVVVEDDVIEDVLEDDESMTEYFDNKFREFAPTAWGIFLLSVVLWLMAILTSFGGSNKRR